MLVLQATQATRNLENFQARFNIAMETTIRSAGIRIHTVLHDASTVAKKLRTL